jgi:glucose-6-phosphate 1-dehydrogenase
MKLYIDNWRWRGVPIYLRTGKRMEKSQSSISICFRHAPSQLFKNTKAEKINQNWLLLGIQPEECIRMEMTVKEPGLDSHWHLLLLCYQGRIVREMTGHERLLRGLGE